jgi:hypothetical protein
METGGLFVSLLTELRHVVGGFSYKYVAPNGAVALLLQLFNRVNPSHK